MSLSRPGACDGMSCSAVDVMCRGTAEQPLVSVIMSARNEEKYIGDALDSILRQSHRDLEIIVVDDYSDDDTLGVVRSFGDHRVRTVTKTNEPPGRAASRNIATGLARGQYVAYHDADDVSHPTRIERQLALAMSEPGRLAVGCWIERELAGKVTTVQLPLEHQSIVRGFGRVANRCTFVCATMLWATSAAKAFPQRPMFRYFEDWDMLCRVAECNGIEFRNLPEALYRYVVRRKGSKSQSDWACYNVFQRACQERRRRGEEEWPSLDAFRAHLLTAPLTRCRWGVLKSALQLKAWLELRPLGSGAFSKRR